MNDSGDAVKNNEQTSGTLKAPTSADIVRELYAEDGEEKFHAYAQTCARMEIRDCSWAEKVFPPITITQEELIDGIAEDPEIEYPYRFSVDLAGEGGGMCVNFFDDQLEKGKHQQGRNLVAPVGKWESSGQRWMKQDLQSPIFDLIDEIRSEAKQIAWKKDLALRECVDRAVTMTGKVHVGSIGNCRVFAHLSSMLYSDGIIPYAYLMSPSALDYFRCEKPTLLMGDRALGRPIVLGRCSEFDEKRSDWGNLSETVVYIFGMPDQIASSRLMAGSTFVESGWQDKGKADEVFNFKAWDEGSMGIKDIRGVAKAVLHF